MNRTVYRLQRVDRSAKLVGLTAISGLLIGGSFFTASAVSPAIRFWLAASGSLACWGAILVFVQIRSAGASGPTPITLANMVTGIRGVLVSGLVGFVVIPSPTGLIAWLPAVVFATAGLLDGIDGRLARVRGETSEFGARFDTEADSFMMLVGAGLVVSRGLAPVAFLAVGLARYVYVAGLEFRRLRGRSIGNGDNRTINRIIFAITVLSIWIALLPVVEQAMTIPLLSLVAIPFLLNFVRSWLVVTERW